MISISATNPCHLYELALALHELKQLGAYHSGYPSWRLKPPAGFPIQAHPFRTVVTYATRRLPHHLRPADHRLFRWQDEGFDRAVANSLRRSDGDFIHAMPGQALHTFQRAKTLGIRTVLNHASGPVAQQLAAVAPEYDRLGIPPEAHHGFDTAYFDREHTEYALADFHCVASSTVRDQLLNAGIASDRIWVVPYAADPRLFFPPPSAPRLPAPRVIFAGRLGVRKGIRTLFEAFTLLRESHPAARLDLYGEAAPELATHLPGWLAAPGVHWHGVVSRPALGDALRAGGVLALPSWEEAFGLVVPQALACGIPCVVSDRVGAKDLIQPGQNGEIFPVGHGPALAAALGRWGDRPVPSGSQPTWLNCAHSLLQQHENAGLR